MAENTGRQKKFWNLSVAIILFARLILNAIIPLMDKTEARYGEIARIMEETGNYVTPQADYHFPFWAKPPLSTWLSAISIKIFGANEFAVRFPAFVIAIILLLLLRPYARRANVPLAIPAFILLTIPEFLLHCGVVSTDMTLLLSMTLLMISFWETMNGNGRLWKYIFFVAIGLGFLAKGPIILILTGPPLFLWALKCRETSKIFRAFPWIIGIILSVAIALPWYLLAEQRTPGFLDYFFVGEHFKRFFDASWKGDKYGFPKQQPLGIIWVFLYGLALPWVYFVTWHVIKNFKKIIRNRWLLFLFLWAVWTPFFFTFSKSLIHTYILPSTFPIALFTLYFWKEIKHKKAYFYTAMIAPLLCILLIICKLIPNLYENNTNTDKYILKNYSGQPLYYWGEKTYSSQFYSHGKVRAEKPEDFSKISPNTYEIIIPKKDLSDAEKTLGTLKEISTGKKANLYLHNLQSNNR